MQRRLSRAWPAVAACALVAIATPHTATAQTYSLATGSFTVPPPAPAGLCMAAFSPDGDVFDLFASVPMGPGGCGLGWPGPASPANVNAFSSGQNALLFGPLPVPTPAGLVTMEFSVDKLATGDPFAVCTTGLPGPNPPDIATEACGITFGLNPNQSASDAAADVWKTPINSGILGGGPLPGTMLHYQLLDGDGVRSAPCPFSAAPPIPLVEPTFPDGPPPGTQTVDDLDGYDVNGPTSGPLPWDTTPADGIPDTPVYYSVDPATAAASGGFAFSDDVIVSMAGIATIYAPGTALGLTGGGADDIDGLMVHDVALDGIYAPGFDWIFYSLSPTSAAIGTADCFGNKINAGDILIEGTPLGFAGVPCGYLYTGNYGGWSATFCGANPVDGSTAGDNLDAFDLNLPAGVPTPLCGPAPEPDGNCHLADATAGPGKSSIKIKDVTFAGKPAKGNQLQWKWSKGEAVTATNFLDPVGALPYTMRFCIYDGSGNPQPVFQKDIAPNTIEPLCAGKPCWKASGNPVTGYKWKTKNERDNGGMQQVSFKAGDAGKSKLSVKAKRRFTLPPSPAALVADVVAQLIIFDGVTTECFKTSFPGTSGEGEVKKQDATQFSAKGP